ncbi:MAG TPA: hypothetical protein VLF93_06195 [Candidatus Saccharimonadales bacterium]|nr:hypothetical protein [Candidatus Saccharimonadales bacterium]
MGRVTKKKKSSKVQLSILLFLLVVSALVIIPSIVTNSVRRLSYGATDSGIQFVTQGAHNGLQLQWFLLPTTTPPVSSTGTPVTSAPAPTSTSTSFPGNPPANAPLCAPIDDQGVQVNNTCRCIDLEVFCKDGQPYTPTGGKFTIPINDQPEQIGIGQNPCGSVIAPGSGLYCVAKPVIYLYPTKQELVDVSVHTAGEIVVSDPHYPENGWKNVLASPNGTLTYNGNKYTELFYESSVNDFGRPDAGIVIPTAQLNDKLNSLLDQLGLIGSEKEEFISYWMPRLKALNSPYIYFSVIDQAAKEKVDSVTISPKPDTEIQFIAYFRPVQHADNSHVLQLPPTPKRVGFTSVEWGGIIDK